MDLFFDRSALSGTNNCFTPLHLKLFTDDSLMCGAGNIRNNSADENHNNLLLVPSDASSVLSDTTTDYSRSSVGDHEYDERFRVDRRKLELMLSGGNDELEPADSFFRRIMDNTRTDIAWPQRLKSGAKSKKDPHVRVAGRTEDVHLAKEQILSVLDSKSNRVTMKLDISYTDHSHIIGRGGSSIRQVMENTGCHIHFPDSNRSNPSEKSNQVSIAGEMEGVEAARRQVRERAPLVFSFELPVTGLLQPFPDPTSPAIQAIQDEFNVQIHFKQKPKVYGTIVSVKGCEIDEILVKEATRTLMKYLCGSTNLSVSSTMDISPPHHHIVVGNNTYNIAVIMQDTRSSIVFPDIGDPNISQLQKSRFTISGDMENVHLARQQIIGSLPLVVMFDVREDHIMDSMQIHAMMEELEVFVQTKPKVKQCSRTVIIKGIERNASNMYEARRRILNLNTPPVHAAIPEEYFTRTTGTHYGWNGFGGSITSLLSRPAPFVSSPTSPNLPASFWNQISSPMTINQMYQPRFLPGYYLQNQYSNLNLSVPQDDLVRNSGLNSAGSCTISSSSSATNSPSPPESVETSLAYTPDNSGSENQLHQLMNASSKNHNNGLTDLSSLEKVLNSMQDRRAPGCEKKTLQNFDYDQKKLMAVKAIQSKPVPDSPRIPTASWVGLGFSKSMPEHEIRKEMKPTQTLEPTPEHSDPWGGNHAPPTPLVTASSVNLSASSYVDTMSMPKKRQSVTEAKDLPSLLAMLDLGKYTDKFAAQEIDLHTFVSLTDIDLKELGISTFGARRKMLMAISEFNKKNSSFSAAPGAERSGVMKKKW